MLNRLNPTHLLTLLQSDIKSAHASRHISPTSHHNDPAQMLSSTQQLESRLQFATYICSISSIRMEFHDIQLIWDYYVTPEDGGDINDADTVFEWLDSLIQQTTRPPPATNQVILL